MYRVSVFTGIDPEPKNILSLDKIFKAIKEDRKLKTKTEHLRALLTKGAKSEAVKVKEKLPAFTPTGVFSAKRSNGNLNTETYTQLLILDIDKIPDQGQSIEAIFEKVKEIRYTFAAFCSPSGAGYKILVKVESGPEHHNIAHGQVKKYFEHISF